MSDSLSLIIPAYNGKAFLGQTLESIFTQTRLPDEVIVVDDASTDGTPDLVAEAARKAPVPVRLIRLPHNSGGPARPMNVGMRAATGELIAVCDQDDIFCPLKLHDQALVLEQHPDILSIISLAGFHGQADRPILPDQLIRNLVAAGEKKEEYAQLAGSVALRFLMKEGMFAIGYPGFLFRRKDWERKGGFDEGLRIASDYDFLCWLATQGSIALIPRIQYLRRVHDGNLTNQRLAMFLDVFEIRARYLAREPWLLREKEASQDLRDQFYAFGFKVRNGGRHWDALRFHWNSIKFWGPDLRTLIAIAKLLPHWILRPALPRET